MKGNLVTLAGLTNNTTGSVILTGQFSLQGVTTITVPQGMKLKIYRFAASGNAINAQLLFTPNINASSPTWYPLDQITMTAAGDDIHEYRASRIWRAWHRGHNGAVQPVLCRGHVDNTCD